MFTALFLLINKEHTLQEEEYKGMRVEVTIVI